MALLPRVRHAHPRLQSSSAPLGPPSSSPFRCKIAGATLSLPSSRQHVVVVPRFPCLCRCNASAGPPSPSPSRQHVAVIPPSPCLHLYRHSVKLPAPQGSHYSVTAGERSEPAEGACPHHHRPQGGRTLVACARVCRVPASLGWQLSTGLLPWQALQSVCLFDPLGAVHIYMWLSFRGFAMLTRGYRIVRPPWGRLPRRHSAAKSRERRLPRRHSAAKSRERRCPCRHSAAKSRERRQSCHCHCTM